MGQLAQVHEHQRNDRKQCPVDALQHTRIAQQEHGEHHAQACQQPVPVERDDEADEQNARQCQEARLHRRGLGLGLERDGRARHQQPGRREEPEQHHGHGRQHHAHEADEALARAVPEVKVLRIADGREGRTRIDRQRLEHHQPRERQVRLAGEHARERHQQEQAHVVGHQRGKQRRAGGQQQRQAALAVRAREQALRGGLQHAAFLDPLCDREQPGQRAHGLPVDQPEPVHRRTRTQEGEQECDGGQQPQQAVAAAVFGGRGCPRLRFIGRRVHAVRA
jgi:hypothetical protein